MSTHTTDGMPDAAADPARLRDALAGHIAGFGWFATAQVEAAFRTVPRHLFLPGIELTDAYAAKAVVTKRDAAGAAISSASSPDIVVRMLEQLSAFPGDRVLEIGTGTGYNAALLAELTGPDGQVTTIDIDEDITTTAQRNLAEAGYGRVRVVRGDGADGHQGDAPYERIIVAAGAWDLPPAWWQQLASGGRIVIPLRLHGSGLTRSVALDRQPSGHLVSRSAMVCGFVPMRGTTATAGRSLKLGDGITASLDASDDADQHALAEALDHPAPEEWTGITVHDRDYDALHLDLWMATTITGAQFARLSIQPGTSGRITAPAPRWAGAALHDGKSIAYLTMRRTGSDTAEIGIAAYGHDSANIARTIRDLLSQWNPARPGQPVITARPTGTPAEPGHGTRIDRPHTQFTVTW